MKTYVKPEVKIENFTLSKHIAACAFDMTNSKNKNECVAYGDASFNWSGMNLFANKDIGCEETEFDAYCYTNGTEGINVFNS